VRAPRHARRRLKQWVHGEGVWKSLWGFEAALPDGLWALTLRSLHGLNSPFTVSGTADACQVTGKAVAVLKVKIP